jgi:hypothetical protein
MITRIGITAGDIWHLLERQGKVSLNDIVKQIEAPKEITLMSIGWLAREGHVVLEGAAPDYLVYLRQR